MAPHTGERLDVSDTASGVPAPDVPDGYTIRETIKEGRHALLYSAVRGEAGQPAALKVLKQPETGFDAAIRAALDALPRHPHLIGVRETGRTRAGRLYAATDLYPAGSLADALVSYGVPSRGRSSHASSRLLSRRAVAIGALAADALQAAHGAGLQHGDLRPAALLINPGNLPVVSGFGFGLLYRDDRREAARLAHWPPALLEGATPSPADDVYGLAATMTTLLTGAPHLLSAAEDGLAALIAAALRGQVPEFPDDVPAGLRDILSTALSPDPGARPGSASELGGALRDVAKQAGSRLPGEQATAAGGSAAGNGSGAATVSGQAPLPPRAEDSPGSPPAQDGVRREEQVPRRAEGSGYRYGLAIAAAVLGTVAVLTLVTAGRHLAGPVHASPAPTGPRVTTRQAPRVTKLDEASYQPRHLTAQPGPGDVVLTWALPAGAVSNGAGIIIRESPALSGSGTVALSRQSSGPPRSYVAASAPAGQQVCFTVGVVVERSNGSVALIQAGPACAIPR
jgi:hypothetical protein